MLTQNLREGQPQVWYSHYLYTTALKSGSTSDPKVLGEGQRLSLKWEPMTIKQEGSSETGRRENELQDDGIRKCNVVKMPKLDLPFLAIWA